jgi:integrase/recombinase XerD
MTVSDPHPAAIAYEKWLQLCDRSPRTIRARASLARGRLAEWGIGGMTADNIFEWLGREGLSRWTRATYYANLKDFCEFLMVGGYLDASPMDDDLVRKPKRPKSLPRPLSEEEVDRVLAVAKGRERDWIMLALLAGLRVHEIAKIRGEEISPDGIYVVGKGQVEATLPIHPDLWAMALRYPRHGWWFPSPYGGHIESDTITARVTALFRPLGIEGSVHRLRHVYGTRLLRNGTNVRVVQKLMRHGSLETTALYTAVDEDEQRAAINRLPSSTRPFAS